jgi:hypothetical protein
MNAPRDGEIVVCVDREKKLTEAWDNAIETDGVLFMGEQVYAKFVMDGLEPLTSLVRKQWIDTQTDKVILSTMVYTQHLEIYTVVNVEFRISATGRIQAIPTFRSIVDLQDSGGFGTYKMYTTIACVSCGLAILEWLRGCCKGQKENWTPVGLLELLSAGSVVVLLLYIQSTVPNLEKMSHEYEILLEVFLSIRSLTHAELMNALIHFFEINTLVVAELTWLVIVRLIAFIAILIQFTQLNLLMRVHPRIAVLANTIITGCDDTMHFLILFFIIFGILAFVGWWTFGASVDGFPTLGAAAQRQFEMVVGEFPFENVIGLDSLMVIIY